MTKCPRCKDIEKTYFISRFINDDHVQDQWICRNCGNVFREKLQLEGWFSD